MNPPARHFSSSRLPDAATLAVVLATAAIAALALKRLQPHRLEPTTSRAAAAAAATPPTGAIAAIAQAMSPSPDSAQPGELARRFRLAGTILGMSNTGAEQPIAILDDRVTVSQSIVTRSQEVVPGVVLSQVRTASVVLSGPAGDEEIFLDKTTAHTAAAAVAEPSPADPQAAATRFGGKEVFPGRWEFSRDTLLDYYSELRDEPERLLTIFDSMDPVYVADADGSRRIEGYVVGVEGEPDFFAAAGLADGDIVRSVNSLEMTNRRRAETFIKNFVEGTVSTFVLEVERNGKKTKQVYQVQ